MVFVVVYILYCSYDRGIFSCFTKFSDGKINHRDDENAFVTVRPAAVMSRATVFINLLFKDAIALVRHVSRFVT